MYRLQGYVSNYSSSSNSFTINGLTVDIATMGTSATVCNTMNCAFANGDFVSVRSTSAPTGTFAATGSTLTVTASDIKVRPVAPTFAVGSTVTIEGPVTQLSGTSFVVRGITVDASGIASSTMGLVNNQIVEVTGTVSASGMLMATSIEVERSATFMLMGSLDSVSATGLSVLGQSFSVASNARFVDRANDMRPFNSTNFATVLKAGDQLVVSGYPSGTGNLATRVERIPTPASPTAGVAGVVSADNAPTDTDDDRGRHRGDAEFKHPVVLFRQRVDADAVRVLQLDHAEHLDRAGVRGARIDCGHDHGRRRRSARANAHWED